MTDKKTLRMVVSIALFVSILGAFVVYAALTQQLEIEGNVSFISQSWKVSFKTEAFSTSTELTGGAIIDSPPNLTDTLISNYKVILTREGDSVTYTFDIENAGYLDAKLTSYLLGTPVCEGTIGPTKIKDEEIICSSNLKYTLKYVSGDLNANELTAGNDVKIGDMLRKQTAVKVALKLEFSDSAIELPTNPVKIIGLDTFLFYSAQ